MVYDNLGMRFKQIRESLGLSQIDLAEKLGVSSNKLSKIETGIDKRVDIRVIYGLCLLAGITMEEFLSDEGIEGVDLEERRLKERLVEKFRKLSRVQAVKLVEFVDTFVE